MSTHFSAEQKNAEQPCFLVNFNHNQKNNAELCIENYFPEKNHSTLSKQLPSILIEFCIKLVYYGCFFMVLYSGCRYN